MESITKNQPRPFGVQTNAHEKPGRVSQSKTIKMVGKLTMSHSKTKLPKPFSWSFRGLSSSERSQHLQSGQTIPFSRWCKHISGAGTFNDPQ